MAKTGSSPTGKPVGRPTLYGERMRNRNVRLTDAQWAAFLALGGPEWLRQIISAAKVAQEKES